MNTPNEVRRVGSVEQNQGPILPVEIARDLWMALHKTRNSGVSFGPALEENEETLYQHLTCRFCFESAILAVEEHETPSHA